MIPAQDRGEGGTGQVTIEVYSKQGCGICEAAKEKLARMGLAYRTIELRGLLEPHAGWREDSSVDALAAYALVDNRLPVIRIGDEYHDYPGAMRRLKRLGRAKEAAAAPDCAVAH